LLYYGAHDHHRLNRSDVRVLRRGEIRARHLERRRTCSGRADTRARIDDPPADRQRTRVVRRGDPKLAACKKWPANLNRVVATGVSPTGETDTIDLTAPALHLSITPSSCKYLAKSGTLAYSVATTGSPEGITLVWLVRPRRKRSAARTQSS
jgi:hypothetical protein